MSITFEPGQEVVFVLPDGVFKATVRRRIGAPERGAWVIENVEPLEGITYHAEIGAPTAKGGTGGSAD